MSYNMVLQNFTKEREKYWDIDLIKPNTIEVREYQKNIIENIKNRNTLIVLPTGLGKTVIAAILAAKRIKEIENSNVLVLAPTKPLVNQHLSSFRRMLSLPEDMFISISGSISKEKRKELWKKRGIFFATPQTVKNDIEEGILTLKDFSLLVFDEAHRCVGDYAYTFIARRYKDEGKNVLILGLTASPGGEIEKIGSVVANLFIENVEIRSYNDPDVVPYIKKIEIEWIKIDLPQDIKHIDALLKNALRPRINFLVEKGFLTNKKASKKDLLDLQKRVFMKLKEDKNEFMFYVQMMVAQAIKILHAVELVETQGIKQFVDYYERMKEEKNKSRALSELLEDEDFTTAYLIAKRALEKGVIHPKMEKIREIIKNEINAHEAKVIVFTQYVETAKLIVEKISDFDAVLFVGQRKGYTQKKQLEIIEKFRKGEYRVLVATSVAEEGLDIPAVDCVIFYEPIPSEIRSIQRRGRTGRFDKGKVVILITKNSLDEAYYWSSIAKERNMRRTLHLLKTMFSRTSKKVVNIETKKVKNLSEYSKEKYVPVVVDQRESKIYDMLKNIRDISSIRIQKDTLSVGDIVINNRVVIERKSAEDFLNSIIDGRIFDQLERLSYSYDMPILIIEGDLYNILSYRSIHENAVKGAIAKIAMEYYVPIIWSKDLSDTVRYIVLIAKRELESGEKNKVTKIIKKKKSSLKDQMVSVVSSIPSINTTLAERLLKKFKTIKSIASAKKEELKRVEGIGDKKAEKIYSIFHTSYED